MLLVVHANCASYCVAASWREFMRALLEGYYVNTHFDYKPASWSEKMRGTIFFN
jgi:hypothetical protein